MTGKNCRPMCPFEWEMSDVILMEGVFIVDYSPDLQTSVISS